MPVFAVAVVISTLTFVFLGVKVVSQGWEYTVERFGQYTKTLPPDLHVIVPFVDRIGARLNIMEQVLDVPSQGVITRDNAMVTVDGVVFYQILDAAKAAYEVRQLEFATLNLTMTNIRTVMGGMDLDQLLSQRDKINAELLTVVDQATNPWGVKVTRIEIKDISPPVDLVDAMARQMKGERQSQILQAEGMKQAAILRAEGAREAAFREAEARERSAEAEAKATMAVSQAIATGDVQAINYFVALKYIESLRDIASAPNGKLILMPWEASSVLGSLGCIGEIAKQVFGNPDAPTPPASPKPKATKTSATTPSDATRTSGPWS